MPRIFGREPAAVLALFAILVKLLSAFVIEVSADQQAVINAVAAAAVGIFIAVVAHDSLGASLMNFAQAVVALAVGYGLDWSADKQALVLSAVAAAIGMWTRTQVVAPVSKSPSGPTAV
ncbi:hypothetical protein PV703_11295 [Streptomyces sp. ME01-24h]|nr:hypothetical protein [Streptomyces sp. ME01-24h]